MKRIKILLLLTLAIALSVPSCNRFEEGAISMRSVKKRLSHTWVLESYYVDGVDKTASWNAQYPSYKIEYRENFTYEAFIGNDSTYSYGVYSLTDWSKKIVRKPNADPTSEIVHDVLKLSTNELWTIVGTEEFHFVAEEE